MEAGSECGCSPEAGSSHFTEKEDRHGDHWIGVRHAAFQNAVRRALIANRPNAGPICPDTYRGGSRGDDPCVDLLITEEIAVQLHLSLSSDAIEL